MTAIPLWNYHLSLEMLGCSETSEHKIQTLGKHPETVHSAVLLGCFYLLYMLYSNLSRVFCCVLSSVVCNCCWFTVCIVVAVLCVLL